MKKNLTVLGSTGSIGTQTLDVAGRLGLCVTALTAGSNFKLMESQARRFQPKIAAMADETAAKELRVRLRDTDVKVLSGEDGIIEAAKLETDTVVSAIVGISGLRPTMAAIEEGGRRIALANKETLVCAGHLFTEAVRENRCELIPVDSEHSAIFQSLMSGKHGEIKKILLTASGGPFRKTPAEKLKNVKKENALKHPNWSMGAKITIDSATMMNKGLEIIEAMHLFSVPAEKIEVVVHPESILHSAVEFCDNAVIAQLGTPDMRIPIQLSLSYPDRADNPESELDLFKIGSLTFERPDTEKFKCLAIAESVAGRCDAAPAVMNAANEAAVAL
ncbi:MAG: 1-deoxy-D-xylulose-5-phosphate reductoisomerase, partial [Oscillospiraceae bacterium]|nr:1-deoxy-D-xylulose-5-phosphate reductoisomerase [Oscillospiraceae bacterium]